MKLGAHLIEGFLYLLIFFTVVYYEHNFLNVVF
jgi:hypothetical protein